jgi:hypothetical protein
MLSCNGPVNCILVCSPFSKLAGELSILIEICQRRFLSGRNSNISKSKKMASSTMYSDLDENNEPTKKDKRIRARE